jgi:cytochrome c-type biogenesis protein CcmH/NrfF
MVHKYSVLISKASNFDRRKNRQNAEAFKVNIRCIKLKNKNIVSTMSLPA